MDVEEEQVVAGETRPSSGTLAEKLTSLFALVRREDGEEYSLEHVASWCRGWLRDHSSGQPAQQGAGETFSKQYLSYLRNGDRANPTKRHIQALAAFFQVSPEYFFDTEQAALIQADLDLLAALRNTAAKQVALRIAGMSPEGAAAALEAVREVERREAALRDQDGQSGRSSG